ncbi:FecR domain-containing protein [Pedobacter sp. MC2016-14]|uniref:FecR family protein n=1 Tax=Pedobacter sp. MC2016-14 TaxID=2897327 RepID=UPI001E471F35|nr:FecR family protein [Pedobacter sp. MC2016-14]MCD0487592.1 FecR domain-containing protein [Pedobacter sp. MC2016-14]
MDTKRISYLYDRYQSNSLTALELEELGMLANSQEFDSHFEVVFNKIWEELKHEEVHKMGIEAEQAQVDFILSHPRPKTRRLKFIHKIVAAAAVLIVVFAAGLFYRSFQSAQTMQPAYAIVPGKQGATLTLASGKQIKLSDASKGKLANEAGIEIIKSADGSLIYQIKDAGTGTSGMFNTLTTAKGETYQVRLPDGTVVQLNADSKLSYATSLNAAGERRVELIGEGYFDVAKDKAHPFIVKTATQQIQVLGTHFNINAYADENVTRTTLLEGSVKVFSAGTQKMLVPGEQASTRENQLSISKADLESAVAWKNGEFVFTGQPIDEIMRLLSRWYNVEVEFKGPPTKEEFEGTAFKEKDITEVLELLELTGAVHFKIEGRKIIVTK